MIVAGRAERDAGIGEAAARCAQRLGWPLLADPLSGARHGETAIATYDLLLRDPGFAERVAPELSSASAICPPPSRCAPGWPRCRAPSSSRWTPTAAWQDPAAIVSEVDAGDPVAALQQLSPDAPSGPRLACDLDGRRRGRPLRSR